MQDVPKSINLGVAMEELIYNLADIHFFFNDLEVRAKCNFIEDENKVKRENQTDRAAT